jgi:predicted DNA-binding transcriptional regulator YafY
MGKAERLFQVVNLVRAHQPITAERLAQRIGVSVRTIYRYIDDLSLSGVALYGEPGRGYSLQEGFELPPLTLSQDEIAALMLGVEMLASSSGSGLAAAARSLLSKIGAVLPAHSIDPASAPVRALSTQLQGQQLRHWDALHQAILQQRAVSLSYLSLDQQQTQRLIYPLGLFYWGGKWTLGSWCTLRGGYRDFRLDCIQMLTLLEAAEPLSIGVNLGAYMRYQAQQWQAKIAAGY